MKKKTIKNLSLNKKTISTLNNVKGGALPSAKIIDCPGNTLANTCRSLGEACPTKWDYTCIRTENCPQN